MGFIKKYFYGERENKAPLRIKENTTQNLKSKKEENEDEDSVPNNVLAAVLGIDAQDFILTPEEQAEKAAQALGGEKVVLQYSESMFRYDVAISTSGINNIDMNAIKDLDDSE
jgi:hypothetical protein